MKRLFIINYLAFTLLFLLSCSSSANRTDTNIPLAAKLDYAQPEIWTYGNAYQNTAYAKGIITNNGQFTAYDLIITVTFYDADDNILDRGEGYFDVLAPKEHWEYSVNYTGPPTTKLSYARVSVTASSKSDKLP